MNTILTLGSHILITVNAMNCRYLGKNLEIIVGSEAAKENDDAEGKLGYPYWPKKPVKKVQDDPDPFICQIITLGDRFVQLQKDLKLDSIEDETFRRIYEKRNIKLQETWVQCCGEIATISTHEMQKCGILPHDKKLVIDFDEIEMFSGVVYDSEKLIELWEEPHPQALRKHRDGTPFACSLAVEMSQEGGLLYFADPEDETKIFTPEINVGEVIIFPGDMWAHGRGVLPTGKGKIRVLLGAFLVVDDKAVLRKASK